MHISNIVDEKPPVPEFYVAKMLRNRSNPQDFPRSLPINPFLFALKALEKMSPCWLISARWAVSFYTTNILHRLSCICYTLSNTVYVLGQLLSFIYTYIYIYTYIHIKLAQILTFLHRSLRFASCLESCWLHPSALRWCPSSVPPGADQRRHDAGRYAPLLGYDPYHHSSDEK